MKNVIVFPGLILVTAPRYFSETGTIEFRAIDSDDLRQYPSTFKFRYQGNFSAPNKERFKEGETVHIKAMAEAYKAKVYGKMGKPIRYPDGTWRYTTKTRFNVIDIQRGLLA